MKIEISDRTFNAFLFVVLCLWMAGFSYQVYEYYHGRSWPLSPPTEQRE